MPMEHPEEKPKQDLPSWKHNFLLILGALILIALVVWLGFKRGVVVEGRVIDALTGNPIAGARVSIGLKDTTTDQGGNFKLRISQLGQETIVNAEGYEPLRTNAERNMTLSLVPTPEKVAGYWFDYWRAGQYEAMYNLLSADSQRATTKDAMAGEFSQYKLDIRNYKTKVTNQSGDSADVTADVEINTPMGKQTLQFNLHLVKEGGLWRIVWYSSSIPPAPAPGQAPSALQTSPEQAPYAPQTSPEQAPSAPQTSPEQAPPTPQTF